MPIDPRMVKWDDAPPVDAVEWDEEVPNFSNVQKGFGTKQSKKPARRQNPLYMASPIGAVGALIDMSQGGPATDAAGRAAVHSVTGAVHGLAELGQRGFRAGANAVLPEGGARDYINRTVDADIAAGKNNEAAYRASMPDTASAKVGQFAGDTALMFAPASKLAKVPGLLPRYAATAGAGAAFGGAQPIVDGESRGVNALWGGALNVLGQGTGDALMAGGKAAAKAIGPELRELARYGESIGLPLTGADLAKSGFVKRFAAMADSLPISGASSRAEARSAAVGRQLAKTIGQDAGELNQSTMGAAYKDFNHRYRTFFSDGMAVDDALMADVSRIQQFAADNLDDTAQKSAANFARRVAEQVKDGRMSGETLQSLDEQAQKLATGGGDRQQVMQELRESLHNAFGRQSNRGPEWRTLNQQYSNYKTLEPLVARNPQGVDPTQLLQAVNATKIGKARMARGQAGDIGDLALLGQQMKPPRTSKTPEGLLNLGVGGGVALAPSVALPLLAAANLTGRFVNSPVAGRLLLNEGRGKGRQLIAPYARPVPVGLLPYLPSYASEPER